MLRFVHLDPSRRDGETVEETQNGKPQYNNTARLPPRRKSSGSVRLQLQHSHCYCYCTWFQLLSALFQSDASWPQRAAGDLPLREGGSSPSCRVSKAWYRLSVSWPMRGREFVVGCVGSERGLLVVGELGPDHFTISSVTFRQLHVLLHNMLWYSNPLTHLRRSTDCWFREADARSGRL